MSDDRADADRTTAGTPGHAGPTASGSPPRDPSPLDRALDLAAGLLPEPPTGVSMKLRALFSSSRNVLRGEALLVRDSRSTGELAGVRTGDARSAPANEWSLRYSCALADVILDMWPDETTGVDVDLQVFRADGRDEAFTVALLGAVECRTRVDESGRASLGTVPYGHYALQLDDGSVEITADVLLEPTASRPDGQ